MDCIRDFWLSLLNSTQTNFRIGKPLENAMHSSESDSTFSPYSVQIVLLVTALLIGLGIRLRQSYWSEGRRIPTVSHFSFPVPTFVNGFYTLYRTKQDGMKFIEELASKYGQSFQMPIGIETALVIADPALAQKILTSADPLHLNKARHIYDIFFPDAFRDGLIVSEYDVWSVHRKTIARSFTYKSFQAYMPFMNEHGKNLADKLVALCSPETGNSVEGKQVYNLIWAETIKIIVQTAMGSDSCTDEESQIIHDNFKRGKQIVTHKFVHPELMLEPIWWLHPMRRELDQIVATLRPVAQKKIDNFREMKRLEEKEAGEAGAIPAPKEEKEDVLGVRTFKCMIEEMISSGASDRAVFAEIGTFITAGHETTALAINMLLYHLACNPECQALCRDEVDSILGSSANGDDANSLSMDDLSSLKYVERCIFESLRLTTTIPAYTRRLDAPMKIDEDLTLPKGKTLIFSPWVIHRNPKIYPNPEKFDPDRFLPENVKDRHPFAFLPFSNGPRNCIGYKFAILEMKVILAWLLRKFEVGTNVDPKEVKYFMELTLMPSKELNLILKERTDLA